MITYKKDNIFNQSVEAVVNPVNCVGIMGKGLALEFKKRFPDNFCLYKNACDKKEVQLGKVFITKTLIGKFKYIINFPTKDHWKDNSKIEDIEFGLIDLIEQAKILEIKSIAIPALGCGLGGLNWTEVKQVLDKVCGDNCTNILFVGLLP